MSAAKIVLAVASLNIAYILYKLKQRLDSRVRLISVIKPIELKFDYNLKVEVDKITLIPLTIDFIKYAKLMYQSAVMNNKDLVKYLSWAEGTPTMQGQIDYIKECDQEIKNDLCLEYSIMVEKDNGIKEIIGNIGFNYIDWNNSVGHIGYWLSKYYQGNGIMTQAVRQLTQFANNVLKLDHLCISVALSNVKSLRIPQRLEFVKYDNIKDVDDMGNALLTYIKSVENPKIPAKDCVPSYFYKNIIDQIIFH